MDKKIALEKLKAKLICMELESLSCIGEGCDRNCDECMYNYLAGNWGEQKEALAFAVAELSRAVD